MGFTEGIWISAIHSGETLSLEARKGTENSGFKPSKMFVITIETDTTLAVAELGNAGQIFISNSEVLHKLVRTAI